MNTNKLPYIISPMDAPDAPDANKPPSYMRLKSFISLGLARMLL